MSKVKCSKTGMFQYSNIHHCLNTEEKNPTSVMFHFFLNNTIKSSKKSKSAISKSQQIYTMWGSAKACL